MVLYVRRRWWGAAVRCDSSSFVATGDAETTYVDLPDLLPVGYVISSQCAGGDASAARFELGTLTETIKCTARGRVGVLNQSPSGCHCTSVSSVAKAVIRGVLGVGRSTELNTRSCNKLTSGLYRAPFSIISPSV